MAAPLVARLLAATALLLAAPAPAVAAPPSPDGSSVWFGPTVADPDRLAADAARLGAAPSLVAVELELPLDDAARADLRAVAAPAGATGTVVVVDLGAGDEVPTPGAAAELARIVRTLERDSGTEFLVRHPGPDPVGFRTLAAVLHAETDAATVWQPAPGATWPGDEAVDWVGVTLGHPVGRLGATGRPLLLDGGAAPLREVLDVVERDSRVAAVTLDGPVPRAARGEVLSAGRIVLAPVYESRDRDADLVTPQPAGPAPGAEPTLDARASSPAWWWLGSGVLLVLSLVAGLLRPRWLDVTDLRDPRVDVLRGSLLIGSAVALLVTLGLGVGSLPGWLVVGGVGTLLALSGCAHRLSEWPVDEARTNPLTVPRHLRRAGLVLLVALALSGLHVLLGRVLDSPFATDPDVDAEALLLLRLAPGPVALLGLVACLGAAATLFGGQCRSGRGWLLLAGSWLLMVVGLRTGWQLPGSGWEPGWPLLVWQLPFVHGFVVTDLLLAHPDRGRRLALTGVGVAGLGATGWGALVLVGLAPPTQPAMVVALLAAATTAAVVCCAWGPVSRLLGWTAVVGRHPVLATAALVAAVVAVAQV